MKLRGDRAMTPRKTGLTIQLIGAAAIATLGVAAIRGVPEFRIRYHLSRLKENPSLIVPEFLHVPTHSPEHDALKRYLLTSAGKERLLMCYRDFALEKSINLPRHWDLMRDTEYPRWLLLWLDGNELKYRSHVWRNWNFRGGGSSDEIAADAGRTLRALQELLVSVPYKDHPVSDSSGIKASVLSVDDFDGQFMMEPEPWATHVLMLSNPPAQRFIFENESFPRPK